MAGLAVLLLAVMLLISPALIGLLAVADAQVLNRLVPWLESAARLFSILDLGRGLFFLVVAGLVLTARGDA